MSGALLLLLATSPYLLYAYNIDISHPIVFKDPESEGSSVNNFGYTVVLSTRRESPPALNLFVGAPNSTNGQGKVYRCVGGRSARPSCQVLALASAPTMIEVENTQRTLIIGNSSGLGASMAMGESTNLTACAPYSIINSWLRAEPSRAYLRDMRGYCYHVPNAEGNTLYRDNEPLALLQRYPYNALINTLYGFSVNYALNKFPDTKTKRIIGQPRLNNVDIKLGDKLKKMEVSIEEFNNLGYSVTSGYFFDSHTLIYVAGAPGWKRMGKFVYIELFSGKLPKYASVEGSVLGEYFGASLATGDFNYDGLDDLAVGAPHGGELDSGRVYIYFGTRFRNFEKGPILQGSTTYGQFGYTLASGDLNSDNRSDLVVSAPWDESGIVYVYYGASDFKTLDWSKRIVQRIKPSEMIPPLQVKRFGFSLSRPVDVDDNGYPDLAIGAYKSGHAVVLRSRPIVRTEVKLISYPGTLQNTTKSFVISVCIKYYGVRAPETQEFSIKMIVDKDHKRVTDGTVRTFHDSFSRNSGCSNQTITLMQGNFLDPIPVSVTHTIKENAAIEFCSSCPVLDRKNIGETAMIKVPFNTGCDGDICRSKLSVTANLRGTEENYEWVVGSGDLSLDIDVKNEGEPAHQTQLIIDIPAPIRLRNVISFCEEKKNETQNAVTLECKIDKPIGAGETISLSIDLDMGWITDSIGGTKFIFKITRRTRSEDRGKGPNPTEVILTTKNVAYVTLTGLADSESLDYGRSENKSMVRIRHTYQVVSKGDTPITKALLTIHVPVSRSGKNDSFATVNHTKFTEGSGSVHKCLIGSSGNQIGEFSPLGPSTFESVLQRRRRAILADNETEVAMIKATDQTIYLNCSSRDFDCITIKCSFELERTPDDVGNMILDVDFNANAFYTSNEESLTVKFNTNASVEIIFPLDLRIPMDDSTYGHNTTAEVSTMLYNIPEPQKLAGWILPVSIFLGILLFCILAFVLFKLGFFKRSEKLKAAKAQDKELVLKTGNKCGEEDGDAERYG